MRLSLILDEGFNENSVDDFLTEYKETLELAKLRAAESPKPQAEPAPLLHGGLHSVPLSESKLPRSGAGEIENAVFPLLDGNAVELRIRRKISPEEAEDLRVMFELWLRKIVDP